MLAAIVIAIIQEVMFTLYLFESGFFMYETAETSHSLITAIALFTTLLCVPVTIWNIIMVKERNDKKDIAGAIVAIATFTIGLTFLVVDFIFRLHSVGRYLIWY